MSHTFAWEKMYDHFDMQKEYGGGYMGADAELPVFQYDASKHPAYLQALDGKSYYDYNNDASWGPALDGRQYLPAYAWDPNDPRFGKTTAWSPQINLSDLFRTGISNTTNLSFARTGKNYMTRVSFSNVSRQGITPNSDAARRYFSIKSQFKPWKNLKISVDYKYTYRKNHNAAAEGYQEVGNALYSYQQWGHTNVNLNDYKNYKRADGSHIFWNLTSGDAELTIWKNLKAGIRVNGNIRSEKYEQTIPNGMFGLLSSYKQEQTAYSDIQTQGRVTWGDRFVDDKLTVDAAIFFEDRQNKKDLLQGFTRNGLIINGFNSCGDFDDLAVDPNNPSKPETRFLFTAACSSVYTEGHVVQLGSNNQIAMARTLRAHYYMHLTDILGMIPYSEALKGDDGNFTPKYDTQEFIYTDLDKELTEAFTQFETGGALDKTYDILYSGNVDKWKKLNASLRMMMAIKMSDVNPTEGEKHFQKAYTDGGMKDNGDALVYKFVNEEMNQNLLTRTLPKGILSERLLYQHEQLRRSHQATRCR